MSMSMATKNVLREAASWLAAIAAVGFVMLNLDTLTPFVTDGASSIGGTQAANQRPTNQEAAHHHGNAFDPANIVKLKAGRGGHYRAQVQVNGRPINVLVDTGATLVALTYEDAERAGIFVRPSDFTQRSRTANGIAYSAPVTLDRLEIGGLVVHNVRASVASRGRLHVTLLGMSFLGRLAKVEMRNRTLILGN